MNTNSTYQEIVPKAARLKPYIKLYYVHQSEEVQASEKITYYPNYTCTLNIYKDSQVEWDAFSRTHQHQANERFLQLLVSKFDRSRSILMKGAFHKLTIVFHPLGINHFLARPLSNIAQSHFSFFDSFGPSFEELLPALFASPSMEVKRDLLDQYFRRHFIGFEAPRLQEAVQLLFAKEGIISIQEIANHIGVSRKTILRLFKEHLAYSPTEYKSIIKFRMALDRYQNQKQKPNLATLAHDSSYYDQADFNFHFKKRTGLSPQQLFRGLETIQKGLYWKLEHVPKIQDKP